MFLHEQYKSHLDFINEVKEDAVWHIALDNIKREAAIDPEALRKFVIQECEQNLTKGPLLDFWKHTGHNVELTIREVWEGHFTKTLLKAKLVYMLQVEWVEQNCPELSKTKQLDPLHTPKAMALWKKLQAKGWIDGNLRPTVSDGMASIIASVLSEALNLNPCWSPFEKLWKKVNLSNVYSKSKLRGYYPTFSKEVINALK